jgi:hypothetical protein
VTPIVGQQCAKFAKQFSTEIPGSNAYESRAGNGKLVAGMMLDSFVEF